MNRVFYLYKQFLFIFIISSSYAGASIAASKLQSFQCSGIFISKHQEKQLVDDPLWEDDLINYANRYKINLGKTDVNLEALYLLLKTFKFKAVVAGQTYLVTSKKENLEFLKRHFKKGVTRVSPLLESLELKNEFILAVSQLLARSLTASEQSKLWITYLSVLPESRETLDAVRELLGHDVFMSKLRITFELIPVEVDNKLNIIFEESEAELVSDFMMDRLADRFSETIKGANY